jgi:hypothetical protein
MAVRAIRDLQLCELQRLSQPLPRSEPWQTREIHRQWIQKSAVRSWKLAAISADFQRYRTSMAIGVLQYRRVAPIFVRAPTDGGG